MSGKTIKILGTVLSILGLGMGIVTGILDGKKMDMKIANEVRKQLKK